MPIRTRHFERNIFDCSTSFEKKYVFEKGILVENHVLNAYIIFYLYFKE